MPDQPIKMPTSGSARRRAKKERNRQAVADLASRVSPSAAQALAGYLHPTPADVEAGVLVEAELAGES